MDSGTKRPMAFLDSDVVAEMLGDGHSGPGLFDGATQQRAQFAINPIVFQELFSLPEIQRRPAILDQLQSSLTMLPVNFNRSAAFLEHSPDLYKTLTHSNDLLIFGSAADCDYLVTYDRGFASLAQAGGPKIVTPHQFFSEIGLV